MGFALQLFSPCSLHGLWTQPLAGDVVTDDIVIFSCPLNEFFFARDPNCRQNLPTDYSQMVLQTRGDCCHNLLWMNFSTALQLTHPVRDHWRIAQPCRRFGHVVHVHRQFHNIFVLQLLDELLMP